jgi:hypothetical protein
VIFIRLNGRFGNQLFIWSTAILLTEATKQNVWIVVKTKSEAHPFVQELLERKKSEIKLTDNWVIFKTFVVIEKLFIKIPLSRKFLRSLPIFLEESSEIINQEKLFKSKFVIGFFQRAWIAERNSKRICGEIINLLNSYKVNVTGVDLNLPSIHVRRGDYLNSPEHWGILSRSFYEQIVANEEATNCFTDMTKDEATEEFHEGHWRVYAQDNLSDLETFHYLVAARKLIIANSSFSWWAGFLAASQGADVYVPEPWFKNSQSWSEEIYPDSFIKVPAYFVDKDLK